MFALRRLPLSDLLNNRRNVTIQLLEILRTNKHFTIGKQVLNDRLCSPAREFFKKRLCAKVLAILLAVNTWALVQNNEGGQTHNVTTALPWVLTWVSSTTHVIPQLFFIWAQKSLIYFVPLVSASLNNMRCGLEKHSRNFTWLEYQVAALYHSKALLSPSPSKPRTTSRFGWDR